MRLPCVCESVERAENSMNAFHWAKQKVDVLLKQVGLDREDHS